MSTCISRAGEFSAHETTEGNYICDLCGVLDEDGLFAERDALRAKVARVEAEIERHRAFGHLPLGEQIANLPSVGMVVEAFAAALDGDA